MLKFTIKRSQWLRGTAAVSRLLDEKGNRCCLGFLAEACGIPDKAILERGYYSSLEKKFTDLLPEALRPILNDRPFYNSPHRANAPLAMTLVHQNDTTTLEDEEREREITELFALAKIEVAFVD